MIRKDGVGAGMITKSVIASGKELSLDESIIS